MSGSIGSRHRWRLGALMSLPIIALIGGAAVYAAQNDASEEGTPLNSKLLNDTVAGLQEFKAEPGFGSFVLDNSTRTVTVYWAGERPAELSALEGVQSNGTVIKVEVAAFTRTELETAAHEVTLSARKNSWPVLSVGPTANNSALRVELDGSRVSPGSDASNQLKQDIAVATQTPVVIEYGEGLPIPRALGAS